MPSALEMNWTQPLFILWGMVWVFVSSPLGNLQNWNIGQFLISRTLNHCM